MARFFRRGGPKPAQAAERETDEPAKPAGRDFRDIQPDPGRIGISGSVPFVRLPEPGRLFADRAARLAALAPGHPLESYLTLLASLAAAQARASAAREDQDGKGRDGEARARERDDEAMRLRAEHGMPLLSRDLLGDGAAFAAILDTLLDALDLSRMPEETLIAASTLRGASSEDRLDLALQVFDGAFPVERMAECLFAAAALQVLLAGEAARLDAHALKPVADGVCPCCGGAPTASVVVGWTPADKARYLSCSLCGTLWNHVRIRCTACGSGEGVSYYGLDEVSKDVQVEACTSCNSYLKHLHQHRDPALDPVADDVASYGLDLKIAEEGFRRAGLNLLFVM